MNTSSIRLSPVVADSRMIMRDRDDGAAEWLTPDREWSRSIFEAARFELNELWKSRYWLSREIRAVDAAGGGNERQPKPTIIENPHD